MGRLRRGLRLEQMPDHAGLLTIVNTNSPRRVDGPMLQGLMEMARLGQPVVVTPFTLAGAMSPVSLAGALSLQNAEALALIAFIQMVRPGAPAVYGGFTSNVDMRTGAPAFGTPEYAKAVLAGGQSRGRQQHQPELDEPAHVSPSHHGPLHRTSPLGCAWRLNRTRGRRHLCRREQYELWREYAAADAPRPMRSRSPISSTRGGNYTVVDLSRL